MIELTTQSYETLPSTQVETQKRNLLAENSQEIRESNRALAIEYMKKTRTIPRRIEAMIDSARFKLHLFSHKSTNTPHEQIAADLRIEDDIRTIVNNADQNRDSTDNATISIPIINSLQLEQK